MVWFRWIIVIAAVMLVVYLVGAKNIVEFFIDILSESL